MKRARQGRGRSAAFALVLALALGGCATPADRKAMTVDKTTVARQHPASVAVTVRGGAETAQRRAPTSRTPT